MAAKTIKTQREKDRMYYIHSGIGLVVMFGFGFLPAFDPITPFGMKMLGILLGLIYLWSMVEMGWPSLMGLIAYLLTGATSMSEILTKGFGNTSVMISVFATAFAFAVAGQGVFDYIAKWVLSKKIFKGRPWLLSFSLIGLVFVLNSLYAGMAVLFLIWALLPRIGEICGLEKHHPWYAAMVVGTVFALVMAECLFPFRPMALFMISMASNLMPLGELPFGAYIVFMFVVIVIMTLLYIAFLKFVVRIDLSKMKEVDISTLIQNDAPLTKIQKFCGMLLILFIAAMILVGSSTLLPESVLKTILSSLTITGVSFIFFAFASIYRIDGKPLLNMKQVASQIPWEIVLLLAVIYTFCSSVAAPETGISTWLAQITGPILGGHQAWVFMFIMFVLTIVLTNFFNNTVIIMIMLNIVASYCATMTLNLELITVLLIIFSQIAFLLPASSVWGGLCHSQADMCGTKNIYVAAITLGLAAIAALVVAIPFGLILF